MFVRSSFSSSIISPKTNFCTSQNFIHLQKDNEIWLSLRLSASLEKEERIGKGKFIGSFVTQRAKLVEMCEILDHVIFCPLILERRKDKKIKDDRTNKRRARENLYPSHSIDKSSSQFFKGHSFTMSKSSILFSLIPWMHFKKW